MSRRRNRAHAQPARSDATPADASGARQADDLHQRAIELREYRMGRGPRPAGFDAPKSVVTASGTTSITFPVMGMTCRSCEIRIAKFVGKLPDVERVSASAVKGQVTVETSGLVSPAVIEKAINRAGYEIGRTPWLVSDAKIWATAGMGVLLVAALAVIAQVTGLGELASGAGNLAQGGLVVALLLGLAAGVSTCMALVGGLVLGLSAAFQAHQTTSVGGATAMRPAVVFVAGRIAGYAALGAVLGALGASVTMPPQLTAILMIVVAVVMFLLGTRLTGLSPRLAGWSPTLPMGLGGKLGLADGRVSAYSDSRAALLGAASFFLPCGFTQAIQIYALSTGNPLFAAGLLGMFALGTAPGLLAIAGLPVVVPSRAKPTLLRLVGVVVIGFALLNGSAGLRLSGFTFPSLVGIVSAAPLPGTLGPDGIQRITTYQEIDGYAPDNVVIYAGYPTEWTMVSKTTASCAASLWMVDLDIRARLSEGPNVFNLPALNPGTLNYTCAMGMYGGRITVVDAPPDAVPATAAEPSPAAAATVIPQATGAAAQIPSPTPTTGPDVAASPSPATQELRTAQVEGGYEPAVARIRAGVPTTWHIDSQSQYSCAAYVVVPELGIEKILEPGDNVIELPPLPAGTLGYMCGMGMFTATIVIE
jgi:sulfite exporter TauE/SafE/plastocyanin domain-containing protein/copper chaperone CopZ